MHKTWCQQNSTSSVHNSKVITPDSFTLKKNTNKEIEKDVKFVVEGLLSEVEKNKPLNDVQPSKRRVAPGRRAYTNNFKMMVINACKTHSVNDSDIVLQYNIDKSIKWKKQEKKICDAACTEQLKMLRKYRPSTRHKEVYKKLYIKFTAARTKGLRVSFAWLYANANNIANDINNGKRVPKSAITTFIRNYGIKLRRVQRKKQLDKYIYLPKIMKWHTLLREGLIKTHKNKLTYDPKWGRFKPNRRFNVGIVTICC